MSTSEEAKGAADEWYNRTTWNGESRVAFAEGYDAATAKLKEELAYWKKRAETEQRKPWTISPS